MMQLVMALTSMVVLLVGCSSPKPTFYSLNAAPIPQASPGAKSTRIMVGPVSLLGKVDRPQLVLQNANNTVQVYEYHRWANSLKGDVGDVIASNVAQALAISNVWSFSQSTQANFDYQVFIDVQNIDAKLGGPVEVDVLWTIKSAPTTKSSSKASTLAEGSGALAKPIMGRSLVQEPVTGSGFEAVVAAQSRAFAKVGQEIARSIPSRSPF
jgi:uncharacterized lipoprotein YmbA